MREQECLSLLNETLSIYSPSGKERELSYFLKKKLEEIGFYNVRTDSALNVLATAGKGSNELFLCGHMDTVPGMIKVRSDGERIYGRGASDAKGPLCALVCASSSFIDDERVKLNIALVTREESDSLGIYSIIKSGYKPRYSVFFEPAGSEKVTIGYRGRLPVRIKVKTSPGHASSPWMHQNAIDLIFSIVERAKKIQDKNKKVTDSISVTPTLLRAGKYHNTVPSEGSVFLDIRIPYPLSSSDVKQQLLSILQDYTKSASFEFCEPTEPYLCNINSRILRAFQRGIILSLKKKPVFVKKTGTGDMNTFAQMTGSECITYGPGNSELSHTENEYIMINDYLESIKVIESSINQYCLLSNQAS